jgi:AcrR family transcriptional regulator
VEAIVEAAARILEQRGHAGFSTNAVAELAGVSIGSLYQYFPRKDALIGALIVRETTQLVTEAEAALTEASARAGISTVIRAAVAHQLRRPILARLLDFEEARLEEDPDTTHIKDRFGVILRSLLSRPDAPPAANVEETTRDLVAIVKGIVDAAGVHGETDQPGLTQRVERAVFGYLTTKSA